VVIGGAAFVLVLVAKHNSDLQKAGGGGNTGPRTKYVTKLNQKQEITLNTMEQDKRDAVALLGQDRPDYQGAFQKYSQIINFGGNDEMKLVRDAQILRQEAIDAVYTMHEALVVTHLRQATASMGAQDAATKARIAKDQREGRANIDAAKRRGKGPAAVAAWTAAINAWNDLLQVIPNDEEAKNGLALANTERRKLVGEMNQAQLDALKGQCSRQMDVAATKFRVGTIRGYQEGIKEYEKVLAIDPTEQTQYPSAAKVQINAGKKKLSDAARPLRDQAVAFQSKTNWLEARKAIRKAMETDPYTTNYMDIYGQIEHECLKNAAQQIQEARVYLDAENYNESRKAAMLALQYADQDTDKENKNAKEIIKTLSRRTETPK